MSIYLKYAFTSNSEVIRHENNAQFLGERGMEFDICFSNCSAHIRHICMFSFVQVMCVRLWQCRLHCLQWSWGPSGEYYNLCDWLDPPAMEALLRRLRSRFLTCCSRLHLHYRFSFQCVSSSTQAISVPSTHSGRMNRLLKMLFQTGNLPMSWTLVPYPYPTEA